MNKKITLPMKYKMSNEVLNGNFHKVKLYVCHNGENYNGSNFSDSAIARAARTLQNIPILAYIERDEEGNALGFGGHEVEYRLEEKDGELYFKEHYLEVPIGVIPSQNEYSIESIDGRNYVVCSGYIWKCYANEAYDILLENNEQSVSMEISCNDGKFLNNGIYDILDYEYLGVTVIGCEPAMENAKVQMSFSKNDYEEKVKELDELLKSFLLKGGEEVEENKEFEQEIQDEIVETEEVIGESQVFEEEECGEPVEECECDKDDEPQVFEEDAEEEVCEECGKPIEECKCNEEAEDEMAKKKKKKCSVEEPQEEFTQEPQEDVKVYTQEELDNAIANVREEYAQIVEELEELRRFKLEYDKAVEVQKLNNAMDELLVNFNVDEELVKELREKVLDGEYTIEQFELQLYRNTKPVEKKEYKKDTNKLPIIDNEEKMSDVDRLFNYYGVTRNKNKK